MSKQTFAHEMDEYYWSKLERVAKYYGHTDKQKYALHLFIHAIVKAEMWMNADLYSKHEQLITDLEESKRRNLEDYLGKYQKWESYYDDEIPF